MLSLRAVRFLAPQRDVRGLATAGAWLYVAGADGVRALPRQGDGPGRPLAGAPGAGSALVALPGGGVLALGPGAAGAFWPAPELALPARPVDWGPLRGALGDREPTGAAVSGEELVIVLAGGLARCALGPVAAAIRAGATVPAAALLEEQESPGATALDALPDGRLLLLDGEAIVSVRRDGREQGRHALAPPHADDAPRTLHDLLAAPRGDGTLDLLLTATTQGAARLLGGALRL